MSETKKTAWDFVEKYYPDYSTCDLIARNDDLCKILHDEHEEGDSADRLFKKEYGSSISQVGADFDKSLLQIYEAAIENFLEQQGL